MAYDISVRLALASLLRGAVRAAAAPFARGGQVFVDEGHCLEERATAIHQVLFRTAPGPPLASSAFALLLLRPAPGEASSSSSAGGAAFEVVLARAGGEGRGRQGRLCIDDVGNPRRPCIHIIDPAAPAQAAEASEIPPETAFRFYFEDPVEGLPGDCLGWALDSAAAGDVSWSLADRSRTARTAWLRTAASTPLLGQHLAFGPYRLSSRPRVEWLVSAPIRAMAGMPRARRVEAVREYVKASPDVHYTSVPFRLDLVSLLAEPSWGLTAALEIGSNAGYTTQVIAQLFRMMFAVDYFTYERLRARLTSQLDNVVYWLADSTAPFALRKLSAGNISFVFVDGDHREYQVVLDTFAALQDVACCVRLLAFHDYCLDGVYNAVQRFVQAKVLRFLSPLGLRRPPFVPCGPGNDRPEGALFEVLGRESPDFRGAVEAARRSFGGAGEAARLLETSWLLLHDGLHGILSFQMEPGSSELYVCRLRGACEAEPRQVGGLRLRGWTADDGTPFAAATLQATLQGEGEEEPQAIISFDRHLQGFSMSVLGGPLAGALPGVVVGQKNSRSGLGASVVDLNIWASSAAER